MPNALASIKKLASITNDINAYSDAGEASKTLMHKAGAAFLRALAADLGLAAGDFRVSSNLAGIAVSGEVTFHADTLYVQLHESFSSSGGLSLLYRTCKGRKDFSGGMNHHKLVARLVEPGEYDRFVAECKRLMASVDATALV